MRTTRLLALAGLLVTATAACSGSPQSANAPTDKPAEKAATAPAATEKAPADKPAEETAADNDSAEAKAASDEDGDCKGQACIVLCDHNARPRDCFEAGEALRQGSDGVTASAPKAISYLEKSCTLKEREACYRLGDLYATGDEGVPSDVTKAIPLLAKACDLGRGNACDLLSKRSESGDGMKKDHAKAIALLAKGCAADDYQVWTCNSFKKASEAKDREALKAVAAWKKACAAKDAAACAGLDRIGAK